ncbi:tyrosine-type recombinase/integrase [Novosphingobium album (ex Liu et al. 2023)]|uniref:Site-specific integrase n=1 Tax=Novosphingobium album (ex Liu et al. 2023) TaxID=3031130 RepID=A0ABT5WVD2_9SPHN|nr:site-specific integrase [Novosphingobium album (ex Liu et al. 2023)]MDE8653839.1 site-specific integrase [Novosphingobium album (ex Liu et al. 2023)]
MTFMPIGEWSARDAQGRRKYVSAEERRRFLAAADRMPARVRALCLVLAYTGCRVSEALALTHEHIDAERGAIIVRTLKRRRTCFRAIPVPPDLLAELSALPAGKNGRLFPIHRATAFRQIKLVMQRAGVAGRIASPRGLRHGFGIRAASAAVPLNLIQRWMGHASGNTTAIYLDAVGQEETIFARRMW